MKTQRLVSVWCPDWPIFAAGVPDDEPAAVFQANRVVARSAAAIAAGVQPGERRRSAQGTCPELQVIEHDPDGAARAFEPVIRAVVDMAPRIEVVEPGWINLLARGPSRYFGGDHPMAERLAGVVTEVSAARVGVGVADGRSAAAIAARRAARGRSNVIVVDPGASTHYLNEVSVAWLRELGEVDAELVDLFTRLGLRTLGQLAALDARDVLGRFGLEGAHAHRLAGGDDGRPSAATDPPPEWWVEETFAEPVEQLDTVVFVAKRLADSLVGQLASDGRICVRVMVVVETEHGERSERLWYRDHGLSAAAIVERVRWQLDGWVRQPDGISGGVALVRLLPEEVRADDGVQAGLWGGRSQADDDAARAIVRLCGLAGDDAVTVPAWAGGRLPAERYDWVPASSVDLDSSDDRVNPKDGPWPGGLGQPAPAVVPAEPIPVDLLDAQGRSVGVDGRGQISAPPVILALPNEQQRLVAWSGPWPVEQRWWSPTHARRLARLQVVTDADIAYVVALERRRWSILATYA